MHTNIENELEHTYSLLHVPKEIKNAANSLLEKLRKKSPFKYNHSINCALLAIPTADCFGIERSKLFFSALLHDIGNLNTPSEVLDKKDGFDNMDMQVIMEHPTQTFLILYPMFKFSAGVGYYHHENQDDGYPNSNLPLNGYSDETYNEIHYCAKVLSVLDAYDAMTSRKNDRYGDVILPSETKSKVLALRHGQKDLIMRLYDKGVLGK